MISNSFLSLPSSSAPYLSFCPFAVNLLLMQIIGSLKCRDTKKCRLFFDQRGIDYHFVDLAKRSLSDGELKSIVQGRSWEDLIDTGGKVWQKKQLAWKDYNAEEEIREDQSLLITPILRDKHSVVIGLKPEEWEDIAGQIKG